MSAAWAVSTRLRRFDMSPGFDRSLDQPILMLPALITFRPLGNLGGLERSEIVPASWSRLPCPSLPRRSDDPGFENLATFRLQAAEDRRRHAGRCEDRLPGLQVNSPSHRFRHRRDIGNVAARLLDVTASAHAPCRFR